MKLSRFLPWLTALATLLSPWLHASSEQPNILFILTDDQGYGDLERHGHPLLKTPHLNRLYRESVRFENFYVSPSCSPTRAALLTGMHEFRNGVTHTIHPRESLFKEAVTLPQLLKGAGYRTACIGKWHLGEEYTPMDGGFDLWANTHGDLFSGFATHNGKKSKVTPGRFREDVFFDEAMDFIAESGEKPFFCYLATISPHTPLSAAEEFIAPYRGKVSDDEATYLGMVANIDYNIGRVLKFLEERNLDKSTIIVFMNDNGATMGLDVYNAGMRGCKCTIWEGGSRAMSFWRCPDRWKPHQVDKLSAHIDVLPTLCDLAGVSVPEKTKSELEGFSLRPLLESASPINWHEDRLLFQHVGRWISGLAASHKYAMGAVRQGNYLLLRSRPCDDPECKKYDSHCATLRRIEEGAKGAVYTAKNAQFHWGVSAKDRWSLYETKQDPACEKDLAEKQPDLVKSLAAAYDQWWSDVFPLMIARGGDAPTRTDR